jgi:hypothetical protein
VAGSEFAGAVNLSVSRLPPRTNASFNPVSITGSGSSTLTVSATRKAPARAFTLTVTTSSGGATHSQQVTLTLR